jgi:hypothetical protein
MPKSFSVVLVIFCIFFTSSSFAFASHQAEVDRYKLDSDIVETFPVPVLFGVDYDLLVADFGDPRGGGSRSHEGQDMRAPQGTPIVSPTEAIVTKVGTGYSAGKYVYTANPGGESFRYMHLDELADIKRGDRLAVGDFIGTVGDTGNAPDGVYHLHFEVKDQDNDPTDPYQRLAGTPFTLKEKMNFLAEVFDDVDDADEYAAFLVSQFTGVFTDAASAEYSLPREIDEVLEDTGVDKNIDLLAELNELIALIPSVVPAGVSQGDTGVAVSLLQTYLIFNSQGPAQAALASASATGYFGPITTAALVEYQAENKLDETGLFDTDTKEEMS